MISFWTKRARLWEKIVLSCTLDTILFESDKTCYKYYSRKIRLL